MWPGNALAGSFYHGLQLTPAGSMAKKGYWRVAGAGFFFSAPMAGYALPGRHGPPSSLAPAAPARLRSGCSRYGAAACRERREIAASLQAVPGHPPAAHRTACFRPCLPPSSRPAPPPGREPATGPRRSDFFVAPSYPEAPLAAKPMQTQDCNIGAIPG